MATSDQVIALIRSHTRGDEERFLRIARQVAGEAAKRGQDQVAGELNELLNEAEARNGIVRKTDGPIPLARPRGELATIMSVSIPNYRLADMVIDVHLLSRLKKIVKEQRERSKLVARGLQP